jgi:predicted permease
VSAILLRPLPFPDPDRLVGLAEAPSSELARTAMPSAGGEVRVSLPVYLAWSEHQESIEVTAYLEREFVLPVEDPVVARGASVAGNFFPFLGLPLHLGRSFSEDEDQPGAPRTLVLGYTSWQQHFGADPNVLGRTISLEGTPFTIIGVASPGFDFPDGAELWTALRPAFPDGYERVPTAKVLRVIGRLAPGVIPEQAQAQLSSLASAVPLNEGWAASVRPLRREITGDARLPLLILMGAVTLVLLIACVNVGNMLLARLYARRQEFAIREALGASWRRITLQLTAESLCLAVTAGALGTVAAWWAVGLLLRLTPVELPRAAEIGFGWQVLGFAIGLSILSGVVVAVLPVFRFRSSDLTCGLKNSVAQSTAGTGMARVRSTLVVAQVGTSMVLLVAAGLLIRSFLAMTSVDPGFRAEHVTMFELRLSSARYSITSLANFSRELRSRVEALPGVDAVSMTGHLPLIGSVEPSPIRVDGRSVEQEGPAALSVSVSPNYFRTLGIPQLSGRDFGDADESRLSAAIVNETFARTFFPGEDPVGQSVARTFGGAQMREIVGVVGDVRQTDRVGPAAPILYTLAAQDPRYDPVLLVRSSLPSAALAEAVRAIAGELDPQAPISSIASMDDVLSRSVQGPRFNSVVLGGFAATALLLATLGLFSLLAENVARRRREVGIRMALGARAPDVVRLIMGQGLTLFAVGAIGGVIGSLLITRVLSSLLFEVSPTDPTTFLSVLLLLAAVALLASYLPARGATRVDPMIALRSE